MHAQPDTTPAIDMTPAEHAAKMAGYIDDGAQRAMALGNRGPIQLDAECKLHPTIVEAYWRFGFYVFEGVVGAAELADLRQDVEETLAAAPARPDPNSSPGNPSAFGGEYAKPPYRYAKPLSDPYGGTDLNNGRHPIAMQGPTASSDAPEWTVNLLDGNLQLMDASLRLYGHPGLLAVAEAILGLDFVPYNEVTFIKEPGLGPAVAWHQDGTTHWEAKDWNEGAHGFNFMTQLYDSTPANCVWALPGTHKLGKVDFKALAAASGSDQLDGAVPMMCSAGDAVIMNRQLAHGSFANTSTERRVTLNAGFFPRSRVLNVATRKLTGEEVIYTADRIHERSRIIQLGIDARQQRFPEEAPFAYKPLVGEEEQNRWNKAARETLLKDYNLRDMFI